MLKEKAHPGSRQQFQQKFTRVRGEAGGNCFRGGGEGNLPATKVYLQPRTSRCLI